MSQYKDLSNVQSDMQKNYTSDNRIVFKDEDEMKQIETNAIDEPESPTTFPNDDFLQRTTCPKTNMGDRSSSDSSDNDVIENRFGFDGDKCSTGYVKVNGKCVPIMK